MSAHARACLPSCRSLWQKTTGESTCARIFFRLSNSDARLYENTFCSFSCVPLSVMDDSDRLFSPSSRYRVVVSITHLGFLTNGILSRWKPPMISAVAKEMDFRWRSLANSVCDLTYSSTRPPVNNDRLLATDGNNRQTFQLCLNPRFFLRWNCFCFDLIYSAEFWFHIKPYWSIYTLDSLNRGRLRFSIGIPLSNYSILQYKNITIVHAIATAQLIAIVNGPFRCQTLRIFCVFWWVILVVTFAFCLEILGGDRDLRIGTLSFYECMLSSGTTQRW